MSICLHSRDQRMPATTQPIEVKEYYFEKETECRVDEIICNYFKVDKEWDIKLFQSIFLNNIYNNETVYNEFNFYRSDSPLINVVDISPELQFFPIEQTPFYELCPKAQNIALTLKKFSSQPSRFYLSSEEIKTSLRHDYMVIALFNSPSYKCVEEVSENFSFSRKLEKVAPLLSKI